MEPKNIKWLFDDGKELNGEKIIEIVNEHWVKNSKHIPTFKKVEVRSYADIRVLLTGKYKADYACHNIMCYAIKMFYSFLVNDKIIHVYLRTLYDCLGTSLC